VRRNGVPAARAALKRAVKFPLAATKHARQAVYRFRSKLRPSPTIALSVIAMTAMTAMTAIFLQKRLPRSIRVGTAIRFARQKHCSPSKVLVRHALCRAPCVSRLLLPVGMLPLSANHWFVGRPPESSRRRCL